MTLLAVFAPNGATSASLPAVGSSLNVLTPVNNPQGRFVWLVLYNYSPFLVSVTIGSSQNWLEPATAASFPVPESGSQVQLLATSNPSGAPILASQVQGVWYTAADGAPSGFPVALPSPASVSSVSVVNAFLSEAVADPDSQGAALFDVSYNTLNFSDLAFSGIIPTLVIRTIDVAHCVQAISGGFSPIFLSLVGQQSGAVYWHGQINPAEGGGVGPPYAQNWTKSFPRGIKPSLLGDADILFTAVEDGSSIASFSATFSASLTAALF